MKVSQIIWVLIQVSNAKEYNSFIRFLQKIPFIGKKVPNRWYRADEIKILRMVLKGLFLPVQIFWGTIFYLFICIGVGRVLKELLGELFSLKDLSATHISLTLLVIFSVFFKTLYQLKLLVASDVEASQAVRIFRLPAQNFLLARESLSFGRLMLARTLVFGIYFATIEQPFWHGLTFGLFLSGLHLFVKMLTLPLYYWDKDKGDKLVNWVMGLGTLVMFGLGCAMLFLGQKFSPQLFMGLPVGLIGLILWLLSYRNLKADTKINHLGRQLLTHQAMKDSAKALENIEAVALEVKEKDISLDDCKAPAENLKGVAYLNTIFMQRLGKHLRKEVNFRLGFIAFIAIGVLAAKYFDWFKDVTPLEASDFWRGLFITVMAGYIVYIGESYMKFCFYHLDRPLLKYNYYRRKDIILATLKERFKSSIRHNFPIFMALNLLYGLAYIFFFKWTIAGLLMVVAGQILSMTFFSLYFLYFYFLLQPFNDGMKSKSKLYNVLTWIIYAFGYQIFRLAGVINLPIMIGILVGILAFLVLGFLAVLRFAPKTFRLRP